MNRQAKLVMTLFVGTVVIILVLLISTSGAPATINIPRIYSAGSDLAATAAYGRDSFLYSNTNGLMLYNYATGKASMFSPSVGLSVSGINSLAVSDNDQFVLFNDDQVVDGGTLYNQLVSKGLNPLSAYWWLYDVGSQSFQPLPQNVLSAKLANDDVDALTSVEGAEQIITYADTNLNTLNTINVSGVYNFLSTSEGYLLQTPSNEILLTKNGTISQLLIKNASLVSNAPNNQAVITTGSGGTRQLAILNVQKDSVKTIASNVSNQPVWLSPGTILYTTATVNDTSPSVSLYTYNLTLKKTYLWKLEGSNSSISKTPLEPIDLISANIAVVSNSVANYYLIGPLGLASPQQTF